MESKHKWISSLEFEYHKKHHQMLRDDWIRTHNIIMKRVMCKTLFNRKRKFKSFKLIPKDNHYNKGDIIDLSSKHRVKVLSTPKRTKWRIILEVITFGLYKAPYWYKVRVIK